MKWSDLSLSKKLMLPIGAVGVLLIVLSAVQISTMQSLSNHYAHINEQYIPSIDRVLNADRDLYQAQIAERTIAMGMVSDDMVKMHSENIDQVKKRVSSIGDMDVSQASKNVASDFLKQFGQWTPKSKRLVSDAVSGVMDQQASTALSLGALDKEFEAMRDTLDKLGEQLAKEAADLQVNAQGIKQESLTEVSVLVLIAVLLTVAVAWYFPRLIVGPLNELTQVLNELASGKGDLTKKMPRMGNDEIGKLAHSFNRFLSGMRGLIQSIQAVANEVHGASQHLKEGAQDGQTVSERYASSMDMVSTANHEMGAAIQEVSSNTQQVASEAKSADDVAQTVYREFSKAMAEIEDLAASVDRSAQVISELSEETNNIASVLDVIKGIAEQTNLLALNAAIEAARAGEQGRGFAVVADEVRTLASKTQTSTGDINDMIDKLRAGVDRAVESMNEGQKKAGQTVEHAQKSQTGIKDVSSTLVSISDRIIQIASAIEEQTSVIDEINQNLEGVKDLSGTAKAHANSIGQAVSGLNQQANALDKQVSSFKVS